jgi:rhamnosyltransferase
MTKPNMSVACIIVTYHPCISTLLSNIYAIRNSADKIFIVDNSKPSLSPAIFNELDGLSAEIELISNNRNLGIGAAQNIGLYAATDQGFDFALLLDQDTLMPSESIEYLSKTLSNLLELEPVAAIAPAYVNVHRSDHAIPEFIIAHGLTVHRQSGMAGTIEIAYAIASGLMINLRCLQVVGMMNERLFIDWVDTEWCTRCKLYGYKIFGTFDIVTNHALGDSSINFFGKQIAVHSPIRHYYIVRNGIGIALYSQTFSMGAKIRILISAFKYIAFFSLFNDRRATHFYLMCLGVRDGIINNLGECTFR